MPSNDVVRISMLLSICPSSVANTNNAFRVNSIVNDASVSPRYCHDYDVCDVGQMGDYARCKRLAQK